MQFVTRVKSGVKYSRYLIFHPFKGMWDLKHERIGNIETATTFVVSLILVNILRRQATGYILNYNVLKELNIYKEIGVVVVPYLLWCLSNWCITTLVDGEGSFKDIVITTAYSLVPMIVLNIPMVILSNILTIDEISLYYLLDAISIIWFVFLLVIGIMTIHQFTMTKTIGTIIIAIVGMIVMVCLFMLFFALIQQFVNFVKLVYDEVSLR